MAQVAARLVAADLPAALFHHMAAAEEVFRMRLLSAIPLLLSAARPAFLFKRFHLVHQPILTNHLSSSLRIRLIRRPLQR